MDDKNIYIGGAIKSLGGGRYGGYLVRYYEPNQRDLQGEWFSEDTNFMLDEHPIVNKPVLFQHAMDAKMGAFTLGTFDKAVQDDKGVWAEWAISVRDERKEYMRHVQDMIEEGLLDFSSGAYPGTVRVNPQSKHIDQWCICEGSATHTPADWRSAADHAAGTRIQTLKSLTPLTPGEALPKEGEPDAADGDVERTTETNSKKTRSSPGVKAMAKNLRSRVKEQVMEIFDGVVEEVIAELAGEVAPEDVVAVTDEVLTVAENEGVDLTPLEDPAAMAMADEDQYKAETPEDEDKAKAVRSALQFIAEQTIKSWNDRSAARKEQGRKAANGFAKNAVANAKAQPGQSVRDRVGSANMTPNGNTNGRVEVSESRKFAGMTASQMMTGFLMLEAAKNPTKMNLPSSAIVSDEYMTTMAHKAQREVVNAQRSGMFAAQDADAVKSAVPWKANELDATNIPTQGAEWVGTLFGTQLWERARTNRILDDLLRKGVWEFELGMGEGSTSIPTEGADPIAYTATEANSLDVTGRPEVTANISPFKTGKIDVSPKEVKIATAYTVMLEEDSVIRLAPQVERQLNEKAQETIEYIILNGDTATAANTNINKIDGTPEAGLYKPAYLAADGMLKNALVTNTAMSRDAGGALTLGDYDATLALFPDEIATRVGNIAFVTNRRVESASRMFPELLAYAAAGDRATIYSGVMPPLLGVDILTSGQLPLANAAGKISVTAANNTKGRLLAFYAPYWALVWKRRVTIESDRDILSGTNIYVLSMRFALAARSGSASAVSYNVGV
jgi:hypothetical protein